MLLAKLRPRIQRQVSQVNGGKTFGIYLADDDTVTRDHARLRLPANVITEVTAAIDPATDR